MSEATEPQVKEESEQVGVEVVDKNQQIIAGMLGRHMERLAELLPKYLDAQKMFNVVMERVRTDNKLAQCTPESIVRAALEASQLGLLPMKHLGYCWLIPRKNGELSKRAGRDVLEVSFQVGARGLVHMVKRSDPNVQTVFAEIVWPDEMDTFSIDQASHILVHQPNPDPQPGMHIPGMNHSSGVPTRITGIIGAYAKVLYKSGMQDFEYLIRRQF
jgi:phage RecT family recombinase